MIEVVWLDVSDVVGVVVEVVVYETNEETISNGTRNGIHCTTKSMNW